MNKVELVSQPPVTGLDLVQGQHALDLLARVGAFLHELLEVQHGVEVTGVVQAHAAFLQRLLEAAQVVVDYPNGVFNP